MASRLAAAGKLAHLSEPQIMGLAAAMSSVGIEAEAGGTAMTQTLMAMEKAVTSGGKKLDEFARIAGMSSEQFSDAWQKEPINAIQAFIAGLGDLDSQGESATQVLEELGLKAKFSQHTLTEEERRTAWERLEAVKAELLARRTGWRRLLLRLLGPLL